MNERVKQLSDEIRRLTPGEQAELLADIADVVSPPDGAEIEQAWIHEAELRLAEVERGDVTPMAAQEAIGQLRNRFPRRP